MVSVVLPTVEWTESCGALREQLRDGDELVVVCDRPDDPVVDDAPDGVELVVAGDPEGCSGKANAVAAALERAGQDRVVLTDDDVTRDGDWLARLCALADDEGAASAVPFYAGGFWWWFVEPMLAVFASLVVLLSGGVWGGGVTFHRSQLDVDAYARDLRRTVGDDSLLQDRLGETATSRTLVNVVRVGGDARTVWHRLGRYARTVYLWERGGLAVLAVVGAAVVVGTALYPPVAVAVTLAVGAVYAYLGVWRATFLLAVPSLALAPLVALMGAARRTFEWGGRTYRWDGVFDVTIEE